MGAAAFAAGVLAAACLLGGMVFFAAVLAPLVFTRLDAAAAGPFIRATFPRYYLYVLATSALAAAFLAARDPASALILALVAAATVWLRQGLMPRINALRDAELGLTEEPGPDEEPGTAEEPGPAGETAAEAPAKTV